MPGTTDRKLITLVEASRLLERRVGVELPSQMARYLIERYGAPVTIHQRSVVVPVTREVLVDGVDAADLEVLEQVLRGLLAGDDAVDERATGS